MTRSFPVTSRRRRRWLGWAGLVVGVAVTSCSPETSTPPLVDGDGFHDPLSMPEQPTLSPASFSASSECASCHPSHYAEWQRSTHAYAMTDPVFRALVAVRQTDFDGAQDPFCLQCHSAIATRGGEIVDGFRFEDLSPIALEGIGCEACHKVAEVVRPYNSGHRLDPDGPLRGNIEGADAMGAHGVAGAPEFQTSLFCAGCHDVVEVSGLELERPFAEWRESPAKEAGTRCQDCHMREREGPAANGGPTRTTHDHRFAGVDVPLAEGFVSPEEREAIRLDAVALLDGAASLELHAPEPWTAGDPLNLVVTVENHIAGHNLPTGTTFIRELWVELSARDADGEVLYRTGDLDANGDLRHHFSSLDPYGDADLLLFNTTLVTANGEPTIFPWRAVELRSTAIPPHYARTFTLFVPTQATTHRPIQIEARLRFRTHGPHLLRSLGLDALVDRIPVFDIASASLMVGASR